MDVLEKYDVKFFFSHECRLKCISSKSDWMSQFISNHDKIETANWLINKIENVLNGKQSEWIEISLGNELIDVKFDETKIHGDSEEWYKNNSVEPDFVIPTIAA